MSNIICLLIHSTEEFHQTQIQETFDKSLNAKGTETNRGNFDILNMANVTEFGKLPARNTLII